jgi:PAS domain S-box-containing protein
VLQSEAPLLITDTASDPILGGVRDVGGRVPFASHLLFPVRHQAETIAILSLRTSTRRDELTAHEIHFCQLVASSMAFSLQSAKALAVLRSETEQTASVAREAQARLESLERYADFFNSAADGILVVDEKGKILFANPRATLVLGQPITSVVGHSLVEFAPVRSQERVQGLVVTWSGGDFPSADLDVIAADGAERVLAVTANSLLSSERATLLIVRDVTAERRMQAELQHTKDFLEKLITSSVDAIVAADIRGLVILFNPGAERIYGYRAEDVVGRMSVKALYPPGFAQEVMRRLRSPQFGGVGKLEQMRAEVLDRSGERMPIALSAALIYENGEEVASFGIFTDLRDKIRIEERLAVAQKKLEISEKQAIVAELAGTAAHELNQPLTSVMGYAEMLKRKLDRESPHYRAADIIVREAERMAEVVRKIGKITRYETQSYVGRAQILDLGRASGEDRTTPVVPEPGERGAKDEGGDEES